MPTFSSALLPTTSGLTFGSSALRWSAYLQDIDIAGTFTAAARLGLKNLEDIRFADQFTGVNVTAQIDAALTDISSVGLVVVPSSMGAGNATAIPSGKAILDLRSGVPKFFTNNSVSSAAWALNNDGTVTSQGVKSVTANPASAGFIRAAKSDAINFRNNANGADVNGLSLDSSDIVQVGGSAGAKTVGPLAIAGALTGITNLSYSGVITSSVATGTAPFSVTSTTVVPNLNVATLNGVTVSGAAASGLALIATSASAASWSTAGGIKVESIQYTPVTIASLAAATTMMSFLLPANELAVGQALWIIAHGTCSNTGGVAANHTYTATVGANAVFTSAASAVANGATAGWRMELLLTCTASGAGGTIECSGWLTHISSTPVTVNSVSSLTATIAIDTTSSQTIAIKGNSTQNNANNSITQRQLLIERVG